MSPARSRVQGAVVGIPLCLLVLGATTVFALLAGRSVLLGVMLGLVPGIAVGALLRYAGRSVRTRADVEEILKIPVVGAVPRLRREMSRSGSEAAPLLVAGDPLDPAAEAYRDLRTNLLFASPVADRLRTLLFTSPGRAEGTSTTALNVALLLAQQGREVLLVDADPGRPSLHRALDLSRDPGFTSLLAGDTPFEQAVRPGVAPNLDVLPSGPFARHPRELLRSEGTERWLAKFEEGYGMVVIDAPPVALAPGSATLAGHADGVVVVLRAGGTSRRAAQRTLDTLRRHGAHVLGGALNEVGTSDAGDDYVLQYYYAQPHHGGTSGAGR